MLGMANDRVIKVGDIEGSIEPELQVCGPKDLLVEERRIFDWSPFM